MVDALLSLASLIDDAESDHAATEAAQRGDINWLRDAIAAFALAPDRREAWGRCLKALDHDIGNNLHSLSQALEEARAVQGSAPQDDGSDLKAKVAVFCDDSRVLWRRIEQEEHRFAIEFPHCLMRGDGLPPPLKDLGRNMEQGATLYRSFAGAAPPTGIAALAAALAAQARQLCDASQPEEAILMARKAVDILRPFGATHPDIVRPRLAAALTILAQSLLECGRIDQSDAASREAGDLG